MRRGVHVTLPNSRSKVTTAVRREEIRFLATTSPGRDLEGLETFGPGRTGVVPDIDVFLDGIVAVGAGKGINDEGGSTGCEAGHDGDGGGNREMHIGKGGNS